MAFIATFQGTAAPEHVEALAESMRILERESREQPGTQRYEFYQSAADPTQFMLFAIWDSEADWRSHVASEAHHKHVASLAEGTWVVRPQKADWRRLSTDD